MTKERVQKILARAGIASRRKAEEMILEGLVTINGKIAQLGDQAQYGKDSIKVSGKLLHSTEALAYLVFNKPKGVISMLGDPQGRPSLSDFLTQVKYRLFPVGRLDFNSEGLIVLTNDGDFAEKVQRSPEILRVYHVKIGKHPLPEDIERLARGGRVGDRMFKPHSVTLAQEFTKKSMIEVTVLGAGAIDLKSYFESKGFQTERIIRVAFGHLRLGTLEPGKFRYLKGSQAYAVLEQPELGLKRQEFEETKTEKRMAPQLKDKERDRERELKRASRGPGKTITPLGKSGRPSKSSRPDQRDRPERTDRPARFDRGPSADRGKPAREGGSRSRITVRRRSKTK